MAGNELKNCQPKTGETFEKCQPKPVRCGCGGEAVVHEQEYGEYEIYCPRCFISTDDYTTEAEAITAWNTAMGERTAKVEDIQVEWGDDEYVNDRMGDMYHYGNCGNCGETVSHNQKYCHECGVRLEWK